jgi:hypothetical protein
MGSALRMVHLRTVPDPWQANVLKARLGAEGIITALQGNLSGPYPLGAVAVLVEQDKAQLAAELLMADEVEAALAGPGHDGDLGSYGDDLQDDDAGSWAELAGFGARRGVTSRWRAWRRRALAAVAIVALAGGPVLAHFVGR